MRTTGGGDGLACIYEVSLMEMAQSVNLTRVNHVISFGYFRTVNFIIL